VHSGNDELDRLYYSGKKKEDTEMRQETEVQPE